MDARVTQLHAWTILVLLTAELKWIYAAEVFTNTWAVQIIGGPEEADRIAKEHGFINHGNVSSAVCVSMRFHSTVVFTVFQNNFILGLKLGPILAGPSDLLSCCSRQFTDEVAKEGKEK